MQSKAYYFGNKNSFIRIRIISANLHFKTYTFVHWKQVRVNSEAAMNNAVSQIINLSNMLYPIYVISDMLYPICFIRYALSNMRYPICFIQYALSDMLYLICFIRYALSDMLFECILMTTPCTC